MKKQQLAFTLMEILVVIALLGIMATLVMNSFLSTLNKGLDSRRKQDLSQIAHALELYNSEYSVYPTAQANDSAHTLPWGGSLNGINFTDPLIETKVFMKQLPTDPADSDNIYYFYESGQDSVSGENYFKLFSCLNNTQDSDYKKYRQSCGLDCQNCHYAISSPNSTLNADITP